jgi:TP901-1 family phage major tail protein
MAANTGIIDGGSIVLFYELSTVWTKIAHATSHTLSRSMDTIEINSKDTGIDRQYRPSKRTWEISCEGLATYDGVNYDTLYGLLDNRTKVKVKLAGQSDDDLGLPEQTGDVYYEGYAYITSLEKSLPNEDNATYSVTLQGTGALEKKTVAGT